MAVLKAVGPRLLVPIYSEDTAAPTASSRVSSSDSSRPRTASSRVSSSSSCPPSSWRSLAPPSSSDSSRPSTPLVTINEETPRRCRSAPVAFRPSTTREIRRISTAIGRKRIGTTTTYLTPVRKEHSVSYSTDPQARFTPPYSDCTTSSCQNLDTVNECARCNLNMTTSPAQDQRLLTEIVRTSRRDINSDSERIRRFYQYSAPSNKKTPAIRDGPRRVDPEPCPASEKLWQQADTIVESVCGKIANDPGTSEAMYQQNQSTETTNRNKNIQETIKPSSKIPQRNNNTEETANETENIVAVGELFKTKGVRPYAYVPKYARAHEPKPERLLRVRQTVLPNMPRAMQSQYISTEQTKYVWEWLVQDKRQSAHDYFVSICG